MWHPSLVQEIGRWPALYEACVLKAYGLCMTPVCSHCTANGCRDPYQDQVWHPSFKQEIGMWIPPSEACVLKACCVRAVHDPSVLSLHCERLQRPLLEPGSLNHTSASSVRRCLSYPLFSQESHIHCMLDLQGARAVRRGYDIRALAWMIKLWPQAQQELRHDKAGY